MWLSWHWAVLIALALAAVGRLSRPTRRGWVGAAAFAREAALILGLYALWQLAGTLSLNNVDGALDRGRWIWNLEQALHLPSELAIQRAALPHPIILQAADVYYAVVHVPALIIFLIWLFLAHRDRYKPWRNTLALLTFACLAIQLVPVGPPRLLPALGFVDAGVVYGPSVYAQVGSGAFDQLSAMPSVHIAWAVGIAVAVVLVSTSKWRWLVLAHPILTSYVVVVTANHWWLDGIVAVAILAFAMAVVPKLTAAWSRRTSPVAPLPVEPEPALSAVDPGPAG